MMQIADLIVARVWRDENRIGSLQSGGKWRHMT